MLPKPVLCAAAVGVAILGSILAPDQVNVETNSPPCPTPLQQVSSPISDVNGCGTLGRAAETPIPMEQVEAMFDFIRRMPDCPSDPSTPQPTAPVPYVQGCRGAGVVWIGSPGPFPRQP